MNDEWSRWSQMAMVVLACVAGAVVVFRLIEWVAGVAR